ncbi:MAG TPA: response regulator, partial [Opitutaceae bacterium]|nr:response regulator [Opitutaceae bacterium]
MKVLAVEDDPVVGMALESALRSLDHEAVIAPDGVSAWETLRRDSIRMVVSDWKMPRMNGLELCRLIRELQDQDYIYFILLTQQNNSAENEDLALEAGIDDFLQKPVDLRELKMRLHVAERILKFTTQVRQLESILPICGYCKKIRDDQNYWQQIEGYIQQRTGSAFSHGI